MRGSDLEEKWEILNKVKALPDKMWQCMPKRKIKDNGEYIRMDDLTKQKLQKIVVVDFDKYQYF